jgi:flagellar biosynthesis/type III secretory pathway protein FliH
MNIIPSPLGWAVRADGANQTELAFLAKEQGWTQEQMDSVESLFARIHTEAFAEGKEDGAAESYQDGHTAGYNEGYEDGENDRERES